MKSIQSPAPLLPEILYLHSKWLGTKEAVICGDRRLSWMEFGARINAVANSFIAQGLQTGDKVIVLMGNGLPMLETLFGIMVSGGVSVPINLSVSTEGLNNMIKDAAAKFVVATGDQFQRIESMAADLPEDHCSVRIVAQGNPESGIVKGWVDYEKFVAAGSPYFPDVAIQPTDYLNVIYSSGTTGLPKGIVHTHQGRRDWAYDMAIALRYHGSAKTLLTIGLYSNISWVAMLTTLLAGGTLVIHQHFDARQFLRTVEEERITHTAMVPIQFQRVIEAYQEQSSDLSSMQAMMACGSPLFEPLKKAIFEVFSCGIIELYGLTEGIITTLEPEEAEGRWTSVGKPLIGTDIKILGDDDLEVAPGMSGEIVSRGRISMPGYLNRPDATEEAIWLDEAGRQWLRSGDIGRIDEQGYLYIVDRKKDMILSGGQNIYPQDIEAVLIQHEAVNEVAVIGAQSRRWGETPIAIVVPETSSIGSPDEILEWCNAQLGRQQRITDLILTNALPRNPNGKILKRELRIQYGEKVYD
ncbi:MAG: acyl--CoA ligase [Pseudomonadales bacterium]|nr:acyl--CoA ligase [Pseudomonadales bacterium]